MIQQRMKFNYFKIYGIWGILLSFLNLSFFTGCALKDTVDDTTKTLKRTTKKIAREVSFSTDFKRVIGIVGSETGPFRRGPEFQRLFRIGLPEYLKQECDDIIVADSAKMNNLKQIPRLASGYIDNFALAIIGRQMGLNAIVTNSLSNINVIEELRGVLWTKDTHYLMRVVVRVEVFDTRTGTKTLDESFSRKVEIDELEYDLIRSSEEISLPELNETLIKLLADMGEGICSAVISQPWIGYITTLSGEKVTLSSGSQVGLTPGQVLEVYNNGRIINGLEGQRFITPGPKTGEIEIISVTENQAEATILDNNGIEAGSTVRRK